MVQRVFWGVVMAAVVLVIVLLDSIWVRMGLLLLLMLVAHSEMLGALRALGARPVAWPGYVYSVALIPLFMLGRT